MRLVNEAYEKGSSPMLLQGCMISNEFPQIKEAYSSDGGMENIFYTFYSRNEK